MMVPGWYFGNGGMPFVSLANTSAVAMVLAATGVLTLVLLAVLGAAAFSNWQHTSGPMTPPKRPPRRLIPFDRHAWAGMHR